MLVTRWVNEAIEEVPLYALLALTPDVALSFPPPLDFFSYLDRSFLNIFNQATGYFTLKCYARETQGHMSAFTFLEAALEYRTLGANERGGMAQRILRTFDPGEVFSHMGGGGPNTPPPKSRGVGLVTRLGGGGGNGSHKGGVGRRGSTTSGATFNPPTTPVSSSIKVTVHSGGGTYSPSPTPTPSTPNPRRGSLQQHPPSPFPSTPPTTTTTATTTSTPLPPSPLLHPSLTARLLHPISTRLMEVYGDAGVVLASPLLLWQEATLGAVSLLLLTGGGGGGGGGGGAPPPPTTLFDDLVVAVTFTLGRDLFPLYLQQQQQQQQGVGNSSSSSSPNPPFPSPSHSYFSQYAGVCYATFLRPPLCKEDYSWLKALGRGGYGMVYAVQRLDTGKLYALKRMDKRLIKARHATRMIVNERDILASVSHPFVTGLQAAFHDEEEVHFVLDLHTGGDLEYYLLQTPPRRFTEKEARFMAGEMLLGLKYLHEHGVMHRDLKPANILLDHHGHVAISDMGLAAFFTPGVASRGGGGGGAGGGGTPSSLPSPLPPLLSLPPPPPVASRTHSPRSWPQPVPTPPSPPPLVVAQGLHLLPPPPPVAVDQSPWI